MTMIKFRKTLLIGAAALALGAGSFSAYADKPGFDGKDGARMSSRDHGKFEEQRKERMAKRQVELHDKLKLNATQEKAWATFTERMKPGARPARPDRAELAKLSAPERMERMLARMQEGEKRMAGRIAATKEFYAVLTPEQQKTFNDQFGSGHGRRSGPH
jgi:Spy/CpxP family protein refolding chaperone